MGENNEQETHVPLTNVFYTNEGNCQLSIDFLVASPSYDAQTDAFIVMGRTVLGHLLALHVDYEGGRVGFQGSPSMARVAFYQKAGARPNDSWWEIAFTVTIAVVVGAGLVAGGVHMWRALKKRWQHTRMTRYAESEI